MSKAKVIIRISNGLGNQMFQYAAGKALAARLGAKVELDTSWFDSFAGNTTRRSFALGHFGIHDAIADSEEVRLYRGRTLSGRILKRIFRKDIRRRCRCVETREDYFDLAALSRLKGVFLHGFWQSEDYFSDHRDYVRGLFKSALVTAPDDGHGAISSPGIDSVAVHVRRGDYVANPSFTKRYGLCAPGYYESAAEDLLRRVPGASFLVFSDDPGWAADNLRLPTGTEYMSSTSDNDGYADFSIMCRCKHFIISNSTYSWWAAWLGLDPDRIVYAPRPWFGDGRDEARIVPDTWIKIQRDL
jgi:hypothetical protein